MLKKAVFLLGNMKIPFKCSRALLNEKIRSLNKLIPFKFVYIALFFNVTLIKSSSTRKKTKQNKNIYIKYNLRIG